MVVGSQSAEALVGTKGPFKVFSSPQGLLLVLSIEDKGANFVSVPKGTERWSYKFP